MRCQYPGTSWNRAEDGLIVTGSQRNFHTNLTGILLFAGITKEVAVTVLKGEVKVLIYDHRSLIIAVRE